MGLYEYMMLSEIDQWNELWENGQFLTNRKYKSKKFSLYALYNFFVEVELDPLTDKILCKGHFKSGETMDKYVGNIDLDSSI